MKPKRKALPKLFKTKPFVLGLIVGILVIASLTLIFKISSEEKHITIPGQCGEVMGTLINKIENEEDCRVQCLNECISIEHKFSRSVFIQTNVTRCNSCECYCKK